MSQKEQVGCDVGQAKLTNAEVASLRLPLGLETPVMTPNGVNYA